MLGILLIDKPQGITSHDVVDALRRRFQTRRVGHAGTLDPMATGVLVVAVGPATRFLQYLPLEPKEYVAEITFGVETDTFDAEGETVAEREVPGDLLPRVMTAKSRFLGLIQQLPPMFSAVKVAGRPLYKAARLGVDVERTPRTVHVARFDLEPLAPSVLHARITCSGGTYVRALAHDLGIAVGCGAHLSKLRRSRVGKFGEDDSVPLDMVQPNDLIPLRGALAPMPLVALDEGQSSRVRDGQRVGLADPPEGEICGLLGTDGEVIGIGRLVGNLVSPECVIPAVAHGPT